MLKTESRMSPREFCVCNFSRNQSVNTFLIISSLRVRNSRSFMLQLIWETFWTITCVGCGNAFISLHAVLLRAARMNLDLMNTAIKHIVMIVMWQSKTVFIVSSHTMLCLKRRLLHSLYTY